MNSLKAKTQTIKGAFGLWAALSPIFLPSSLLAQTTCDSSKALGHIKRLEGPADGVAIVRAGGSRLANPPSLTPVCAMDDIRTTGAAIAYVEVYGAAPVIVRSFSPWKPLRPRAATNLGQNIWAMVTDKFLPDLGRVETSQRLRGGPLEPSVARIPSVRNGTDKLPIGELNGTLRVPVFGELWLAKAELRGPDGIVRTNRVIDGQDIVFDTNGLQPGRYDILAMKPPTSRLPPPSRPLGAFTLVAGSGPNPQETGQARYKPEVLTGLRALWLADTSGQTYGLLAYQLAGRAQMEAIPNAKLSDVVLKTLSQPAPTPASVPTQQ